MNNNGAGYPAFLSVCQKCFAEFAAGMAANNLDYFLPRYVRGKKYFARRECFFVHLWTEKRGSERILFCQKRASPFFDKLNNLLPFSMVSRAIFSVVMPLIWASFSAM